MARTATRHYRAQGTGSVRHAPKGPGWIAYGPQKKGVHHGVYVGRFDTYKQAETALDAYLAGLKKEVA